MTHLLNYKRPATSSTQRSYITLEERVNLSARRERGSLVVLTLEQDKWPVETDIGLWSTRDTAGIGFQTTGRNKYHTSKCDWLVLIFVQ